MLATFDIFFNHRKKKKKNILRDNGHNLFMQAQFSWMIWALRQHSEASPQMGPQRRKKQKIRAQVSIQDEFCFFLCACIWIVRSCLASTQSPILSFTAASLALEDSAGSTARATLILCPLSVLSNWLVCLNVMYECMYILSAQVRLTKQPTNQLTNNMRNGQHDTIRTFLS